MNRRGAIAKAHALGALLALLLPGAVLAHDPPFTEEFDRDHCTFTSVGSNLYFPLWPGYSLLLEGEEEDDEGETVEVSAEISVLADTEIVDGVETRVVEERESEDGELVEVSRNFMAICRETGAVWYFGEDVDDYEDGEIVSHEGGWRAGVGGAEPGILMPGMPLIGARHAQELAPGVAEDRGEVISRGNTLTVPAGTFEGVLEVSDTNPMEPDEADPKFYAPGVGLIKDEDLELVEVNPPSCLPDADTLCLNDGRFQVEATFTDFEAQHGIAMANQTTDDSGEFWFFSPDNVELLVKVLDACDLPDFNSFWVFAAGLTNVEVTITVTDTETDETRTYPNPLGNPFQPVLDTAAFPDCS
jgi:hypothetical protein